MPIPVPQNLPPLPNGQPQVGPAGRGLSPVQDELLFFDHAKKALESTGAYDDFLKLLNMFSRDIIDTKTLVERAEPMLGEGDLMREFKELLSWDGKSDDDEGPPGSLRTAAPDYYTARPPDDGQGPSYRRLPDSVSDIVELLRTVPYRMFVGGATSLFRPGSSLLVCLER